MRYLVVEESGEVIAAFNKSKEKVKGRFVKMMDGAKEAREKLMDKPATFLALHVLAEHLGYNTGIIVREDGGRYRVNDLAEDMKTSRQTAGKHIAILEKEGILKKVKTKSGIFLAIDPYYYANGERVLGGEK